MGVVLLLSHSYGWHFKVYFLFRYSLPLFSVCAVYVISDGFVFWSGITTTTIIIILFFLKSK